MQNFKPEPGDRVTVELEGDELDGASGTVERVTTNNMVAVVMFEDNLRRSVFVDYLKKAGDPPR